jgi:hypothetical protein
MKIYITIFLGVFFYFSNAQVIDFERVHPQSIGLYCTGSDILQSNDSIYIGIGKTVAEYPDTPNSSTIFPSYYHMIFKINNQGDSLFIKNLDFGNQNYFNQYGHYAANDLWSMIKISENSYMATGYTQTVLPLQADYDVDCIFHKFNINGDSLATHALSVPDSIFYGHSIIKTSDDYVMAVGFHAGLAFGQLARGDIMKLDTNGNLIWRKVYSSPIDMHLTGIVESPDGGFIIAGMTFNGEWFNTNAYNPVMMKIDSVGNMVWQKYFSNLQYHFLVGPSVTRTTDDNYIFSYPDYAQAPKHFKLDENGDTLWTRSINLYQLYGYAVQSTFSTSDNYGGIVAIAADIDSSAIYRLSADGDLLWQRKFGISTHITETYSIKKTSDNGFIVTGGSWCCNNIWPNGASISSLYIIKFDSLGLLYPIGINEHTPTEKALLSVPYPNPATSQITFTALVPPTSNSGMGEKGAYLLFFDMRGAQLQKHALQTGINTLTIDVSSLAAGEYLCVLSLDGYNAGGKRFVVSR